MCNWSEALPLLINTVGGGSNAWEILMPLEKAGEKLKINHTIHLQAMPGKQKQKKTPHP